MARRSDDERLVVDSVTPELDAPDDDAGDEEEQYRRAARAYFRAAPPYCIQFEDDGRISLRRKRYSFWGEAEPAASTQWQVLSYHGPD